MKRIKHTKIKNTGLLFEILIRKFSSDIISGKEGLKARHLIKKFFNENTELSKELSLYNMLMEYKIEDKDKANIVIDSALKLHEKLDSVKLKKEKYTLVNEINNEYDLKNFFNVKINDYKLLASCYKLFEFNFNNGNEPLDLMQSRFHILENITSKKILLDENSIDMKLFLSQDSETKIIAYNEMVKSLNENYVTKLSNEQRDLLSVYISSNMNDINLRENINSRIDNIITEINNYKESISDDILIIKLKEISKSIEKIKSSKILNEGHIITIMKFYDLLQSLRKL
jgi:hypothetical protein